ncbi:MAG: hypothetical protein ACK5JC_06680 [Bacteroidota bacterium]
MNKTLSINISGCIFNIEEDAYQVLYRYLEDIKGYFTASDGREEIMADIEARIAELLTERNAKPPRVVMLSDINAVMQAMGKPEEFSGNEQKSGAKQYTSAEADASYSGRKRVFRDGDDKLIGGVYAAVYLPISTSIHSGSGWGLQPPSSSLGAACCSTFFCGL